MNHKYMCMVVVVTVGIFTVYRVWNSLKYLIALRSGLHANWIRDTERFRFHPLWGSIHKYDRGWFAYSGRGKSTGPYLTADEAQGFLESLPLLLERKQDVIKVAKLRAHLALHVMGSIVVFILFALFSIKFDYQGPPNMVPRVLTIGISFAFIFYSLYLVIFTRERLWLVRGMLAICGFVLAPLSFSSILMENAAFVGSVTVLILLVFWLCISTAADSLQAAACRNLKRSAGFGGGAIRCLE
ncbi:hypothetical protein HA052_04085 [Chromobacterium haemolyticum]|uniref:Uncharacterized protein n=1 Tax=Chromobacterium fluminis TaxID=3044269 RepID=A0ABX0KXX9_9NEIS|nr:hypothetical protein [Chromobacterium haemolyticum]NHR04369.1 hypothetical protein [Chromobacterium haemolyticum]